MNKILLVYEDYADLMAAEGALKRAGFDVIGLSNEYAVAEQMLAFNPDLVVGAGRGGKVSSLGVGKRLKEMTRWSGKSVLIFQANFKPDPQEFIRIRVDLVLEAPVPPVRLVQVVGKILGHDEAVLLERLNKATYGETPPRSSSGGAAGMPTPEDEAIYVKGGEGSLSPERVHEDSQDLHLNSEEQAEKLEFRFGDRMSEMTVPIQGADATPAAEEKTFSDVDLGALERELLGGGVPQVERVEIVPLAAQEPPSVAQEIGKDESSEAIHDRALADLAKAQSQLAARVARYSNIVADVKVSPKSTLTRVEARRRQKEMAADWDSQSTKELDELRREFTKALFKK